MMDLLVENALRVAVVLTFALIAVVFSRRKSAAFRHRALSVAVVCSLVMPGLMAVAPAWEWPAVSGELAPGSVDVSVAPGIAGEPVAGSGYGMNVRTLAPAVWGLGFLVSVAALATGFVRLRRIGRRAKPIDPPEWLARADVRGRRVALLESPEASHLMTWGFFRPKIVLPPSAREWSEDRLQAVLGHELAHVRRNDWAWQIAAELLCAVHWLNPLAWLACRRLREESERASDDAVLAGGVDGEEYAGHLVALVRTLDAARTPSLAFVIAKPSVFERRIGAMLDPSRDRRPVTRPALAAIVGAFLCAGLVAAGCGATRTAAVQAPGGTGVVSGTVTDRTGARIPGVELTLEAAPAQSAGDATVSISDRTGTYRFDGVEPGDYRLTASLPGFQNARIVNIGLGAGQTLEYNVTLQVAGGSTAVSVTGRRPAPPPPAGAQPPPPPPPVEPFRIGGNVSAGRLLSRVDPAYPREIRDAGMEGIVVIEATIRDDGVIGDARVISGPPGLGEAALDAVRRWRYVPYLLNGQPIETTTTITVNFALEDPE